MTIHLIITDQRMPHMTGVELLAQVAIEQPNIIRMIMSGFIIPGILEDASKEIGIYKYLRKPWDTDELKDILNQALEKYLGTSRITEYPAVE